MLELSLVFFLFTFSLLARADTNVTAEDSQIAWPNSTPLWSGTNSLCSSQGVAHFAFETDMSVSYTFTGTAIFMRVLRSNVTGSYSVAVDDNPSVLFDGFTAQPTCDIQFGQTGLPFRQHTVTATLIGLSPEDASNTTNRFFLEVDAFIHTVPDAASSSSLPTSSSISPTSSASSASSSSTSLPMADSTTTKSSPNTGLIVGITLAVLFFLSALAFWLYRSKRRRTQYLARRITIDSHPRPYISPLSDVEDPQHPQLAYMKSGHRNILSPRPFDGSTDLSANPTHLNSVYSDKPEDNGQHHAQNSSVTSVPLHHLAAEVAALMGIQSDSRIAMRHDAPPMYEVDAGPSGGVGHDPTLVQNRYAKS